ncbi:SDR family NAD(P)-dependent oxidoreductase [Lacibacterium aquatile]|uniref:SDR family NAD(P)-dependent oxidoreductase n=1 Tax=Lacibacterium aquatile TaxID=1168082 RepID=A0ABW5DML6_9PROT
MNIAGQAALVTGGASGLGYGTAQMLKERGAKVTILDLGADRVAKAAADLGVTGIECDVTSDTAVEAAIAKAAEANGVARILVACAGVAPAAKVVGRNGIQPLAEFTKAININLIGTFNVLRVAAAGMMGLDPLDTGERGAIIMTASVAAFEGQIGQAAYAASKGGVAAMTLPLAREFAGQGIRVMSIAPGIFGTPMVSGMPQNVQDALGAMVPFPSRLGRADEYAALVESILGNVMLNGSVIRLDGAIRMAAK